MGRIIAHGFTISEKGTGLFHFIIRLLHYSSKFNGTKMNAIDLFHSADTNNDVISNALPPEPFIFLPDESQTGAGFSDGAEIVIDLLSA